MTDRIDRKLAELGLALPAPAAPVASYVPAVDASTDLLPEPRNEIDIEKSVRRSWKNYFSALKKYAANDVSQYRTKL